MSPAPNVHRRRLSRSAAMLLPACLLLVFASRLPAQNTDWLVRISEKELQFAYENVPEAMKRLMWDMSDERNNYYRNMPTVELQNNGTVDISQIQLTIGDSRFQFGELRFPDGAMQCPCHPSLQMLSDMAANGGTVDPRIRLTAEGIILTPQVEENGNLLVINISKNGGGGLAPGELLRFKIDIDADPGFTHPNLTAFPDFRTVMFDINAGGTPAPIQLYGDDPAVQGSQDPLADNTKVSVTHSGGTPGGTVTFPDRVLNMPESLYVNDNFRPYGVMENVDIFTPEPGGPVIPEPSSAVLVLMGLLSGAGLTARRRRWQPQSKLR